MAVLGNLFHELFLGIYARHHRGEEVSHKEKYSIPKPGTKQGIKKKCGKRHFCQPCRDRDKLANPRQETPYKRRDGSSFIKVLLGFDELSFTQQKSMPQATIHKAIDKRPPQPEG